MRSIKTMGVIGTLCFGLLYAKEKNNSNNTKQPFSFEFHMKGPNGKETHKRFGNKDLEKFFKGMKRNFNIPFGFSKQHNYTTPNQSFGYNDLTQDQRIEKNKIDKEFDKKTLKLRENLAVLEVRLKNDLKQMPVNLKKLTPNLIKLYDVRVKLRVINLQKKNEIWQMLTPAQKEKRRQFIQKKYRYKKKSSVFPEDDKI